MQDLRTRGRSGPEMDKRIDMGSPCKDCIQTFISRNLPFRKVALARASDDFENGRFSGKTGVRRETGKE